MSFNLSFNTSFLVQTRDVQSSNIPTQSSPSVQVNGSISVTVYPLWYKHTTVGWSVPPSWGKCVFNVYYGQTQDGPWNIVNPAPISGAFLTETVSKDYSRFTKGYYVVEAVLLDMGRVVVKSAPTTNLTFQNNWVGLRSAEIQRREYILLSKFVGVKTYLFRKKTWGQRCTNCWSPQLEKVVKDHCTVCMGTSFDGGYFDPILTYIQYDPSPNDSQRSYYGTVEANQIGAWTISIPDIRLDDIIVRVGDWNIYSVDRINTTELQANVVRQATVLTQISKDSVEYNLVRRNLPDFPVQYA